MYTSHMFTHGRIQKARRGLGGEGGSRRRRRLGRNAKGVDGMYNGREFPVTSRLGGLGSVVSSPSVVRGGAPAEN